MVKIKLIYQKLWRLFFKEFEVKKLGVVGGPLINSLFLDVSLLDEISLLIGPGIDGRKGMPGVFDGFGMDHAITHLKLKEVKSFDDGAVWIRYTLK